MWEDSVECFSKPFSQTFNKMFSNHSCCSLLCFLLIFPVLDILLMVSLVLYLIPLVVLFVKVGSMVWWSWFIDHLNHFQCRYSYLKIWIFVNLHEIFSIVNGLITMEKNCWFQPNIKIWRKFLRDYKQLNATECAKDWSSFWTNPSAVQYLLGIVLLLLPLIDIVLVFVLGIVVLQIGKTHNKIFCRWKI